MRIGRQIVDAVVLVLAGSGCWSTAAPAPATSPTPPGDGDHQTFAAAPPAPDPWDGSAGSPDTTTLPPSGGAAGPTNPGPIHASPIDPRAATNPRGFCEDYKRRTKVDKKRVAKAPPRTIHLDRYSGGDMSGPRGTTGRFDRNTHAVHCTIVHEEIPMRRQAVYTPTCCPSGRGNMPCPGPQTVTVTDRKLLIEDAVLGDDGRPRRSTLEWRIYPHQFERHNCGRRPEGLVIAGELAGPEIGAELARMAELEAASVPAFERLARELAHHGAPAALIRRARAAMRDEIRHARAIGALARRYGCPPREIEVPRLPCRGLAEIARENAVEGCVREAFGALIATFQAARAIPELRGVFAAIARDERRHAELSEDVHAWVTRLLDPHARDTVLAERAAAAQTLRDELPASIACETLGLPGPHESRALFDAYFAA